MRTTESEALTLYKLVKKLLAASGNDKLQIEPRLTLKRDGTVTTIIWRPHGFSETALCVVDTGLGEPCVVTWRPGAFRKIINRYAGAMADAELA